MSHFEIGLFKKKHNRICLQKQPIEKDKVFEGFRENLENNYFGPFWAELWTKREFSQNRALHQFKKLMML